MNHATLKIGDATSVASRLTSNNAAIRPEKMVDCLAVNKTAGVLYLQFFDGKATVPANATVPDYSFPVQAGAGGTLGRSVDCDGGIWVWSSTDNALTAAGASGSIVVILKG